MKTSFSKDIFRSIIHSASRFISIFLIVALGAGFYAGLNATAPDMRLTMDRYYKQNNMMDLRLLSSMGFVQEDLNAIQNTAGIDHVMPAYSADTISKINGEEYNIILHSLPQQPEQDNPAYLNRPVLLEGRLPLNDGECVINRGKIDAATFHLGDTVSVAQTTNAGENVLKTKEYKIVGFVNSPYYVSFSLGSTPLGDGKLDFYCYVPASSFSADYYTEVFVTLSDAASLLVTGNEYKDLSKQAVTKLQQTADTRQSLRLADIKDQARQEISDAQQEYDEKSRQARQELADAELKITDAQNTLTQKEKDWADSAALLEQNAAKLETERTNAKSAIAQGQAEIDKANIQLSNAKTQLLAAEKQLTQAKQQIDAAQKQIDAMIAAGLTQQAALAAEQLKPQIAAYQSGLSSYQKQKSDYEAAVAKLAVQQSVLQEKSSKADAEFAAAQAKIEQGRQKLASGKTELENGKRMQQEAQQTYETSKLEAFQKLDEAKAQITDAEEKINELEEPKWFILDLETNTGFASFQSDADRIASIATVFPVIFFLVAALVALTTMTRMVEEERTLIGIYKALGYTRRKIAGKYLIYAAVSSVCGAVLGIGLGVITLPPVIWNAYRMMYVAPGTVISLHWLNAAIAFVAAVSVTMLSTYFACHTSLKETTADLLLPKAPKSGKRILLERIPVFWSRLSFIHKVTARNLFRYKKRLCMTVIGIAGCTALLVTGFGIKDSVSDIVGKQYADIYHYNTIVSIAQDGDADAAAALLGDSSTVSSYARIEQKNITLSSEHGSQQAYAVISPDQKQLSELITFRQRHGSKPLVYDENAVLLTEKLAKQLGVSVGDTVSFPGNGDKTLTFTVTGITENYVFHYLYIGAAQYAAQAGESPQITQFAVKTTASDTAFRQSFSETLLANNDVITVSYTDAVSKGFDDMIASLNSVVAVLIFCAGLLAFIVLYNLTNINVTERQKEIATIKVLGFYDKEVSAYIYRETFLLTVIGMLTGLVLGIFMHSFVIQTAEIDMVMFGRIIKPLSFVWAALLTLAFSAVVNLAMYRKLKKVNMVESLKSVD